MTNAFGFHFLCSPDTGCIITNSQSKAIYCSLLTTESCVHILEANLEKSECVAY